MRFQPRLTALLKEIEPKRVLFTTFTLSLNWFESFCLPVLRLGSCEHVDLLVDSRKACRLGDETASAYAGNTYRVVSVYMNRSGFFHPKIAYLQGHEDDTLVIGSGNLTGPGQGGNLENIDAVNAQHHPHVFEEFAVFIDIFCTRDGLSDEVRKVLLQYAERARQAARKAPAEVRATPRSAWLIHTLETPAYKQLGELLRRQELQAKQLTVFSPFHTPSGQALNLLAKECGSPLTRVGLQRERLNAAGEFGYIAPFEPDAGKLPRKLSYVTPAGEDCRPLHAKCFEVLAGGRCLVMSGSVNATLQSLCETRNVEVSLARLLSHSPFEWNDIEEPETFIPCEYDVEELATIAPALQASWKDAEITGLIVPAPAEGPVTLEVWSRDQCEFSVEGHLDAEGGFRVRTTNNCATERALRLIARRHDSVLAIGWLNVESELGFPTFQRDIQRAANNIRSGKPSDHDLHRVLDQFKRILNDARQAEQKPSMASGTKTASTASVMPGRYDQPGVSTQRGRGISQQAASSLLAAAFAILRRKAVAVATAGDIGMDRQPAASPTTSPRQMDRSSVRKRIKSKASLHADALQQMLFTLPKVLTINATSPWVAALVALSACQVVDALSGSLNTETPGRTAGGKIRRWLKTFASFEYDESNRNYLVPLMSAMSACGIAFGGESGNPTQIKELLQAFTNHQLNNDSLLYWTDDALKGQTFDALSAGQKEAVLEAALDLGEMPSLREDIESLVDCVLRTGMVPTEPRFTRYEAVARELHRRLGKPRRAFGVISSNVKPLLASTRCPACDEMLRHDDVVNELVTQGAALHTGGCGKPVFVGLEKDWLRGRNVPRTSFGYTEA